MPSLISLSPTIKGMAYLVVRFYLSLFSINKVIKLAKKVTKALFEPIITPADLDSVQEIVGEMKVFLPDLLSRYLPRLQDQEQVIKNYKHLPHNMHYKTQNSKVQ